MMGGSMRSMLAYGLSGRRGSRNRKRTRSAAAIQHELARFQAAAAFHSETRRMIAARAGWCPTNGPF